GFACSLAPQPHLDRALGGRPRLRAPAVIRRAARGGGSTPSLAGAVRGREAVLSSCRLRRALVRGPGFGTLDLRLGKHRKGNGD
ncbi:unnamed protein product, partial [Urochloa humidicola]